MNCMTHPDCDLVADVLREKITSCNECASLAQSRGDTDAELRFAREARNLSATLERFESCRPNTPRGPR